MKGNVLQFGAICSAISVLMCAQPVHADPVRITSGVWLDATDEDGGTPFDLGSDAFSVTADWGCCAFGYAQHLRAGDGFMPGPVNLTFTTTPDSAAAARGTAVVNGTTYDNVSFAGTTLEFQVPLITLPAAPGTNRYTLPFTMTGTLDVSKFGAAAPLISDQVGGAGHVTFSTTSIQTASGVEWILQPDPTNFIFESTGSPSPTPEPASLILLGTGLLGAVIQRMKTTA